MNSNFFTKKRTLIVYGIAIHIFLFVVLAKSDFLERVSDKLRVTELNPGNYYRQTLAFQKRVDQNIRAGSVVFLGDSFIAGLAVENIVTEAVNYGIGGDSTQWLADRIKEYSAIDSASLVVLSVGHNDLVKHPGFDPTSTFQRIFGSLSSDTSILVSSVLPVDESLVTGKLNNATIRRFNQLVETVVDSYPNVSLIDSYLALANNANSLPSNLHIGDGVHLNKIGNSLWSDFLSQEITKHGH